MRLLFRSPLGRVLVIWPVTRQRTAELLTAVAWATGGDSIVAMDTRGCYGFVGVPKSQYYAIADLTVQSLAGEPLDAFAIAEDEARRFLPDATTISQYFTLVEQEASKRRRATWEVLRKKVTPRVWIILTGDDERRLEETTALLSQGLNAQIDVQRVLNMLDDRKRDANYLKEWRRRRSEAAYLMRTLDVRILPLPPNAAVAAVRAYGSDKLKAALQKQTISADACIQTIMRTRLYKQIVRELGGDPDPHTKGKPVGEKTAQEYKRVQQNASVDDKPLNYALGRALEAALFANGHRVRVMVEKRRLVEGVTLQPDIQVWIGDAEVICLEPTWRTAGGELEGELEKRQSSIGMGAIQRYALGKIHEYVKALEL
ncbi:MAG: hypothetical protein KC457_14700 [Myxococcales bacterium]|nr:hypothetical protein [Myxococcales bacterium]